MRKFSMRSIAWLCAFWSLAPAAAWSDNEIAKPSFTAFLSADGVVFGKQVFAPDEVEDLRISGDFLLTWQPGPIRFLAELVASSEETELERLQVGWEAAPNTILWIGRFHQPASFWGYLYHHGQFAQTAITKPQIDNWEDSGGLLPQHLEGILFDTVVTTSRGQRFDISLGAGISPRLVADGLEPIEILQSRSDPELPAYAARVTWFPDALQELSAGLLVAHAEIADTTQVSNAPANRFHIDQLLTGFFFDYPSDRQHLTAVAYRVSNRRSGGNGARSSAFWSGYLQSEMDLPRRARLYGRLEATSDVASSEYLRGLEPVSRSRLVLGLRWDLGRKQAITGEIARTRLTTGTANELRLQWSAVFP